MKTVVTILQLLCGLAIILIVLFQSGKSQGLSGACLLYTSDAADEL